jgi:putative addiction module CopG family antidote
MPTITVKLEKQQQEVLDTLVESGRFASTDEAVQAGVEALKQQELNFSDALRDEVRARVDRNEPCIPAEEVFRRLRQRIADKAAKRGA